jgi:hypothetical protein
VRCTDELAEVRVVQFQPVDVLLEEPDFLLGATLIAGKGFRLQPHPLAEILLLMHSAYRMRHSGDSSVGPITALKAHPGQFGNPAPFCDGLQCRRK